MDNYRGHRRTNFENDLQNILADYLSRNLSQEPAGENSSNENPQSFNSYTSNQPRMTSPQSPPTNSENIRYNQMLYRILDNVDRSMHAYHNNVSMYLSTMNRIIGQIPAPQTYYREPTRNYSHTSNTNHRNTPSHSFGEDARRNPLRPSHDMRTNTAQPVRYDHILTYTLPQLTTLFANDTNTNDLFNSLFQNVVVRPTPQELDNATERITYSEDAFLMNDRCPISLEEFAIGDELIRIHHCGHVFTELSFSHWFQSNVRCPVCRHDIRDMSDNVTSATAYTTADEVESEDRESNEDIVDENTEVDNSMNIQFGLFNNSGDNLLDIINTNIQSLIDPSSNLGFRLEIPIQYSETYDSSNNVVGRTLL